MSEVMRILHVVGEMNRGGAETMVMNLYRHIDRSRIQFDFVEHTDEHCAYDDEIRSLGGFIYRVPKYTGANHFKYLNSWYDLFRCHPEYKIIHGHVRSTGVIYLGVAHKYGATTIAHSHSTSSGRGLAAVVKNALQYQVRYTADYLFACSRPAGEWLFGKRACDSNRFHMLSNAINANGFTFCQETRDKLRYQLKLSEKFVVGHVGNFLPPKNHAFIIDVFARLSSYNNNAVLLLVGDGELRSTIELKCCELGLSDKVVFTGVRTDVAELLQAMDVFIFPSIYEGVPVTLVEAQASGIRCIASSNITKDIQITDKVEFLSIRESPELWAARVQDYTGGYVRENTYKQICDAGYNINKNADWLQAFYSKLLMQL